MGCGCGGSKAGAAPRTARRGPQAPGYAWTGPQKRAAAVEKKTPKAKLATNKKP